MASSPLDPGELDALMSAIKDGGVPAPPSERRGGPVVPYDLTSQDRIIRGQMPTLDSINDRIASLLGRGLSDRTRIEVRAVAGAATVLKFADVHPLLVSPATVAVLTLGSGHGPAVIVLEGLLGTALLAAALGDRKARAAPAATEGRVELTAVERMVLRNLLGLFSEAMHVAWADVIGFRPEVLRFESDPRMAMIAPSTDVAILCPFELTGTVSGRLLLVIPYAAVEPAKKLLAAPPRPGSAIDGDARFSAALAREIECAEVKLRVEIGRRRLNLSDLVALEVGSVLTLDRGESSPLPVFVEGRVKLTGMPRVVGGSLAIVVDQALSSVAPPTKTSSPLIAALEASLNAASLNAA
jgi:flagellar motor switch protein FliM